MDITKVSADILNGPNWGTWAVQIQAAARVLNCWAVIVKSELRYPIIQAIRSQWESQDLPTF